MDIVNLLQDIPPTTQGERIDALFERSYVRIERIISSPGTRSETFDQSWDEWILILQGAASLQVNGKSYQLVAGDSLAIPAHATHQVLDTSTEPLCIWLAVHIDRPPQSTETGNHNMGAD